MSKGCLHSASLLVSQSVISGATCESFKRLHSHTTACKEFIAANIAMLVPGREVADRIQALQQRAGSSGRARLLVLQARAVLHSTAEPSGIAPWADPAAILQPAIDMSEAGCCIKRRLIDIQSNVLDEHRSWQLGRSCVLGSHSVAAGDCAGMQCSRASGAGRSALPFGAARSASRPGNTA
jgi:hypothetical protein